jgi:hypothetical protein
MSSGSASLRAPALADADSSTAAQLLVHRSYAQSYLALVT